MTEDEKRIKHEKFKCNNCTKNSNGNGKFNIMMTLITVILGIIAMLFAPIQSKIFKIEDTIQELNNKISTHFEQYGLTLSVRINYLKDETAKLQKTLNEHLFISGHPEATLILKDIQRDLLSLEFLSSKLHSIESKIVILEKAIDKIHLQQEKDYLSIMHIYTEILPEITILKNQIVEFKKK